MSKKADAWRDYQEAAMVDMLLETLPKVCHLSDLVAVARPRTTLRIFPPLGCCVAL